MVAGVDMSNGEGADRDPSQLDASAFRKYIASLRLNLVTGVATEHTHRSSISVLLQRFISSGMDVVNEPTRVNSLSPDIVIRSNFDDVGWMECKNIGRSLDDIEQDSDRENPSTRDGEQLKRYRSNLPNLILTNYLEFRWFVRGKRRGVSVKLGEIEDGKIATIRGATSAVSDMMRDFINQAPRRIGNPRDLAEAMASFTRQIRDAIVVSFNSECVSDSLTGLKDAFERSLVPGLSESVFADMYAQTLAYGMFASRINAPVDARFDRDSAGRYIPMSNPFLRRIFISVGATDLEGESFVEIVDDLALLLANADIHSVLRDFGKRTATEDPLLHFYETFLSTYDPKLRKQKGVYYTPEPVVSYIVRSVDWLLKNRFGCIDGLADSSKSEHVFEKLRDGEIVQEKAETHRVQILDPACGTGTFLSAVIEMIKERFKGNEGMWDGYVARDLIPRLSGFELLLAPYAMAHLKLWNALVSDNGEHSAQASIPGVDRIGVYLTNALQPSNLNGELIWPYNVIAQEAKSAEAIKRDLPIMVVLGNPPYSIESANSGEWIRSLIRGKEGGDDVSSYFEIDGEPLGERYVRPLNDDYVKFIRFGQWRIERSGSGILALITNHSWIDSATFRGMRQSLLDSFDEIYIYNLHGNAKREGTTPKGDKDENVFDIMQGVAISIFVKSMGANVDGKRARVFYSDLWGDRDSKYNTLATTDLTNTEWREIDPKYRFYVFRHQDTSNLDEYVSGWSIKSAFLNGSSGIKTNRDRINRYFAKEDVLPAMEELISFSAEEARQRLSLGSDSTGWKVEWAQQEVNQEGLSSAYVKPVLYRTFDIRYLYYTGKTEGLIMRPRYENSRHMLSGENLGIISTRQQSQHGIQWAGVGVTRNMIDCCAISDKTRETNYLFPLYLYSEQDAMCTGKREPNLAPTFIKAFSDKLNLSFVRDGTGDLESTFGPEDIFHYIYAILHSVSYRTRYADFLKIDFPHIPITSNPDMFRSLTVFGDRLKSLHLLDNVPSENMPAYPVTGDHLVDGVRYTQARGNQQGRVYINSTQYFDGVSKEVWEYRIGGYQPAQKWLKDRNNRILDYTDQMRYRQICVALADTLRNMSDIDALIDGYGGWPMA